MHSKYIWTRLWELVYCTYVAYYLMTCLDPTHKNALSITIMYRASVTSNGIPQPQDQVVEIALNILHDLFCWFRLRMFFAYFGCFSCSLDPSYYGIFMRYGYSFFIYIRQSSSPPPGSIDLISPTTIHILFPLWSALIAYFDIVYLTWMSLCTQALLRWVCNL